MVTPPHSDPDPVPGLDLDALRQRLRDARAERGACPPWDELRADLLPGGARRPGREERLGHRDLCPYCDAHVREWERSIERTADTLDAVERGVARGVVDGARRLIAFAGPRPETQPVGVPPPSPSFTQPPSLSPMPARVGAATGAVLRLLVVEAVAEDRIPPSVFLCAQALGAEVAHVARIDDLMGDPDLEAVCGIVFAGGRPASEWPEALRRGRDLAPGCPVVILAGSDSAPGAGAQRALGGALLSVDDSAERLLVALDPRLR